MKENMEGLKKIFEKEHQGDSKTLEVAINELRKNGATQMETVKILIEKLSISLREADFIVLNSEAWNDRKKDTEELRKGFIESFLKDE